MYGDYSPEPNRGTERILVVEGGEDPDEVIAEARSVGATSWQGDDEIFWIVFEDDPHRLWDFTKRCLRDSL
jgi:hypothetical protein